MAVAVLVGVGISVIGSGLTGMGRGLGGMGCGFGMFFEWLVGGLELFE